MSAVDAPSWRAGVYLLKSQFWAFVTALADQGVITIGQGNINQNHSETHLTPINMVSEIKLKGKCQKGQRNWKSECKNGVPTLKLGNSSKCYTNIEI